jgi:hypothetical protein
MTRRAIACLGVTLGPSLKASLATSLLAGLAIGAAAAIGAGAVRAASPSVNQAIKAIEAVGSDPARLKLFCDLNKVLQAAGDKEDPGIQKQLEAIISQLGPDFGAAWDVGDELDETSPDGQEFYTAVDTLADKCQ